MFRVAIVDYGAEFRGSLQGALDPQIERAFGPLCARVTDKARIGVCFASSKGDLNRLESGDFLGSFADAQASRLAHKLGALGRICAPNAACASGAHAIALGASWIASGDADLVLAGALEPPQHPLVTAAYRNMGALSKSGIMRPFDVARDGFVPTEGGGFVVLASEAFARANDLPVRAYVGGWSLACDAHHITRMAPSGESIERAIRGSLEMAGAPPIDYVNAHGTATINDVIEARALHRVLGGNVAVSSTKPLTGHLMGAAGAVEAVLCLQAMENRLAPPTLNLENVDAQIELDLVVGQGRNMEIGASLSLNYGFGGHIGCLVFVIK